MGAQDLALKTQLEEKLTKNQTSVSGEIGKCNDHTFQLIISKIRSNPTSDLLFLFFVQSLNLSYKTQLQMNKVVGYRSFKTAAQLLKKNWQNGVMLSEIRQGDKVLSEKFSSYENAFRIEY